MANRSCWLRLRWHRWECGFLSWTGGLGKHRGQVLPTLYPLSGAEMEEGEVKRIGIEADFVFDPEANTNADGSQRIPTDDEIKEAVFAAFDALADYGWFGGGKWKHLEDVE